MAPALHTKKSLPPHLKVLHLQSKKDTESIKRWLCKHASPTIRAGRKTSRSTFIRRAKDIQRQGIDMTPYIEKRFQEAIRGRQKIQDYHQVAHAASSPGAASHEAFIFMLMSCFKILSTAYEIPPSPVKAAGGKRARVGLQKRGKSTKSV